MASHANDLCPSSSTTPSTAARIRRSASTWLDDVFCRLGLRRGGRTEAADEGAVDDLSGRGIAIDGSGAETQSPVDESAGQGSAINGPGAETQSPVEESAGQGSAINGPGADLAGICATGEYLPSKHEVYQELFFRFVLNTPQEDRPFLVRLLFHIEDAHWFYEDYLVQNNPLLKTLNFQQFVDEMFTQCAPLRSYLPDISTILERFNAYRYSIPVCGAAILNESYDKCLLVKGSNNRNWGFPRGKKDQNEDDHLCALREVMEETGFDMSGFLDPSKYMEIFREKQRIKLFKIWGVNECTEFAPVTKKEISASPLKVGDRQAYIELKRIQKPVEKAVMSKKDSRANYPSLLAPYQAPQQHPQQQQQRRHYNDNRNHPEHQQQQQQQPPLYLPAQQRSTPEEDNMRPAHQQRLYKPPHQRSSSQAPEQQQQQQQQRPCLPAQQQQRSISEEDNMRPAHEQPRYQPPHQRNSNQGPRAATTPRPEW